MRNMRGISILYAEDDRTTRNIFNALIQCKFPDIDLYIAENGYIGLDLFKKHMPNIVITDINMPLIDGIQMARKMKAINPEVIIIAISGNNSSNSYVDAIEAGINYHINKPVDFKCICYVIENSINEITMKRQARH